MAVQRIDHVGVVVDDLPAAIEFFVALGLELGWQGSLGDEAVDRIVGLEGVRTDVAFLQAPGGHGRLELIRFHAPSYQGARGAEPPHAPGLRHLTFAVDDIEASVAALQAHGAEPVGALEQYGESYRLCYLRGPAGIILELAEQVG